MPLKKLARVFKSNRANENRTRTVCLESQTQAHNTIRSRLDKTRASLEKAGEM